MKCTYYYRHRSINSQRVSIRSIVIHLPTELNRAESRLNTGRPTKTGYKLIVHTYVYLLIWMVVHYILHSAPSIIITINSLQNLCSVVAYRYKVFHTEAFHSSHHLPPECPALSLYVCLTGHHDIQCSRWMLFSDIIESMHCFY